MTHSMLLCPPDHFEIEYVINPWMNLDDRVDRAAAHEQWQALRTKLEDLGVQVEVIAPQPGLPDMVFTGDGGAVYGRTFICSRFRHPERQPEAGHFRRWFEEHGYDIRFLPDDIVFEGLGDVSINSGVGVAAYGPRTSEGALPDIKELFSEIDWIASLELVDPRFFHIGVSLALLDERTGIYVPDAFSADSRRRIEKLPHDMIPVSDEDAVGFAVNAVVVGRDLVVHYCSPGLRRSLESRGFRVHVVDVSEFLKSGGGTRCLVLPLTY
jgi:N-dimethylarginine dimethylaminohydrolase